MRTSLLACLVVAATTAMGVAAQSASADTIYLQGVTAYKASTSTGGNVGGAWEFDNLSTPNSPLSIAGHSRGSAIELFAGDNVFAWDSGFDSSPLGLAFYLGSANSQVGFGTAPSLVGFLDGSGAGPWSPAPGTSVATVGQYSGDVGYSGATYFDVGSNRVTLTQMSRSGTGGTFTLTVTAVPEPATLALLGFGAGVLAWKRRTKGSNSSARASREDCWR